MDISFGCTFMVQYLFSKSVFVMKRCYWDLDDVLAEFMPYVNVVRGTNYQIGEMLHLSDWEYMREHHQRMFRELKPSKAVNTLYQIQVETKITSRILTALPFDDHSPWQYANLDKLRWCDQFVPGVPMFVGPYAHDKWRHCKPGDLLIDDKRSNCEEWEAAGGKAYLYRGNNAHLMEWVKANALS